MLNYHVFLLFALGLTRLNNSSSQNLCYGNLFNVESQQNKNVIQLNQELWRHRKSM